MYKFTSFLFITCRATERFSGTEEGVHGEPKCDDGSGTENDLTGDLHFFDR